MNGVRILALLLAFAAFHAGANDELWDGKLILVTHGSTILALTRIPVNHGRDIMMLTPLGEGRFAVP